MRRCLPDRWEFLRRHSGNVFSFSARAYIMFFTPTMFFCASPNPQMIVKGNPATKISDIENVEIVFKDGIGYDSEKLILRSLTPGYYLSPLRGYLVQRLARLWRRRKPG